MDCAMPSNHLDLIMTTLGVVNPFVRNTNRNQNDAYNMLFDYPYVSTAY